MEGCAVIPALDDYGLLPPGVWDCTLAEVAERFATNPHRQDLWGGLLRFLENEVLPLGTFPVWIDGSFTRSKPYPEDIDAVVDLSGLEPAEAWPVIGNIMTRQVALKEAYHVDAWARHPELPNDLAVFFQYAGPKVAAEIRVDVKQAKGILRVQP